MNTLALFGVPGIMISQFERLILVTTPLMRELCPQRLDVKPIKDMLLRLSCRRKWPDFPAAKRLTFQARNIHIRIFVTPAVCD